MNRKSLYLWSILVSTLPLHATQTVRGNGSLPNTFATPIQAAVFDRPTETFFVGLASGSAEFALARIGRTSDTYQPLFTGIAPEESTLVHDADIAFLALTTNAGNLKPLLAGNVTDARTVFLASNNGAPFSRVSETRAVESAELLDAGGLTTGSIIGVAANNDFIFAAVGPDGGTFGEDTSGIAVVHINRTVSSCQECIESIEQTAANVGDGALRAKTLDPSTPEVFITNSPTSIQNAASIYWDEQLQRLFIGIQLQTPANAGDGIRSIVTARVTTAGELVFYPLAPDTAFDTAEDKIIGVISNGSAVDLASIHVNVLHASTGPSYLIVNGGNGAADLVNDGIFALPLVDNPSSPTTHGTLADATSTLVNHVFVTPATLPGQLLTDGSDAALVGVTGLPIQPATSISGMTIIGDTVYVSLGSPQDADNDTGLFFSHALFDSTGKVTRWTPWERAFPFEGISGKLTTGRISFFGLDALTGQIWAVDGEDNQTVVVTQWDRGNSAVSLATKLNEHFGQGCYSALDLDAHTRGFDGNCQQRYALFGGVDRIIFARTGENSAADSQGPNVVITDFSLPDNFLVTYLPAPTGCVTCLEYTRFEEPNLTNNSFCAGTRQGLFEFGPVNPATFGLLTQSPFTNVTWTRRTDIEGSIVDLVASGNGTYVLTFQTSRATPFKSRLYLIPPAAPAQLIAQTGSDIFANVVKFNGVRFISTDTNGTTEQLLLATNTGLYRSSRIGGVQQSTTTQANAGWQRLEEEEELTTYVGISAPQAPAPITTLWPFALRDEDQQKTYTRSSITQLNGTSDAGSFSFVPENFNGSASLPTVPSTIGFTSDGARRTFIVRRPQESALKNYLMMLPFQDEQWAVTNPNGHLLFDPGLSTTQFFTWVTMLQTSGILMAGTHNGVVALE